jgi:gas vesicle protein
MKNGKVVVGLLAGVAAGAILGVLFAPHSGKRSRRKIAHKSEEMADNVKEKFNDLLSTINHKYESVIKEAGDIVDNGKTKYNVMKKDLKNIVS